MLEDRYDIKLTDASGTAIGFVADWSQGGAGLKIEPHEVGKSTAVSTKGDYGVRDANDYQRIIQTDWTQGAGQKTYDRDADSESAFAESKYIDVGTSGELRLGPASTTYKDTDVAPFIINHKIAGAQGLWVSTSDATAVNKVMYSTDGATWTVLSGSGPATHPIDYATNGEVLYAVLGTSGAINTILSTGATTFSTDGSNAGMTNVAFASGILYATKGSATVDAQLGSFSSVAQPVWTALSPAVAQNINAAGTTFGLEPLGNFVYWGITNGSVTKVFKAQYVDGAADILQTVATFPTGFVGACLYSYLDTVYVGGHFDGETTDTGIGTIYAIIDDTPVLLTNVGEDKTADNRVLSMCAYERSLYFVSNSHIWRWDLVNGGYSHWAGPLNTSPAFAYSNIGWTGEWTCNVAPGAGSEPDATVQTTGTTSAGIIDSKYLRIRLETSGACSRTYITSDSIATFDNSTGSTLEVKVPASFIDDHNHGTTFVAKFYDGTRYCRFHVEPLNSSTYRIELYSAGIIGAAVVSSAAEHTFRLTLKENTAKLYDGNVLLASGNVGAGPGGIIKAIAVGAFKSLSGSVDDYVTIDNVRWTDDGAFAPGESPYTEVTDVQIACWKDKVAAACSGKGVTYTSTTQYKSVDTETGSESPYLRASRSSGNMPTVDKYFHAVHVSVADVVPDNATITVSGTIDGKGFVSDRDTTQGDENLLVFPIGVIGRNLQYQVNVAALPQSATLKFATVLSSSQIYVDGLRFTAGTSTNASLRTFSVLGTDAQDAAAFCTCVNDETYGAPGVTATNDSNVITLVSTNDTGLSVIENLTRVNTILASDYTPVITEVAVLFRPTPKQTKLYSYYLKVWDEVESNVGEQKWDVNPETACDFLEDNANTTVLVERKGTSYTGTIESLQYIEAPPSRRSSHRTGLYRVDIRRLT